MSSSLPWWRKPNWVGPLSNAAAVVLVGAMTSTIGLFTLLSVQHLDVKTSSSTSVPLVLDNTVTPAGVEVRVVDGTVVVTCGTASEVPLTLIRKNGPSESTVVCKQSGMVLP